MVRMSKGVTVDVKSMCRTSLSWVTRHTELV
jgi:hypothetical protein